MADILTTMLTSLALTIVIECGLAFALFKIREATSLAIVLAAQLITNPIVVGVCSILVPIALVSNGVDDATFYLVSYSTLAVFEVLAFVSEGFLYSKTGFAKSYKMSLVLNLVSFLTGVVISILF